MRMNARYTRSSLLAALWVVVVIIPDFARAQVGGGRMLGASRPEAARLTASRYRILGRLAPEEFLSLRVVDGALEAEIVADLPVETVRIEVEGSDATWVCRRRAAGVGTSFTLTRYDFDVPPDRPWSIALMSRPDYLTVTGQFPDAGEGRGVVVRLTQTEGAVGVTCASVNGDRVFQFFEATSPSVRAFQTDHPAEARRYLAPLLRGLGGRATLKLEPGDVYRVFDTIRPDPAVVRRLDALLVRLASDDYEERERATRLLGALGPAGVLAGVRRDVTDLSPEARSRLAQFVESQCSLSPTELVAARRDGQFLLDCLEDADVDVRAAAKEAVEQLVGRRVAFESLSGEARVAARNDLRRRLASALAAPTTRPVQGSSLPAR